LRRPGAARFRAIDAGLDGTGKGHCEPVLRARDGSGVAGLACHTTLSER
jgi:hypothetical protein